MDDVEDDSGVAVASPPVPGPASAHLPPGWVEHRREAPSGRRYPVFVGPTGVVARSRREVWRIAEGVAGADGVEVRPAAPREGLPRSPVVAAVVRDPVPEVAGDDGVLLPVRSAGGSPVVSAVASEPEILPVGSVAHRFPDSLHDYQHYYERPSSRRPPRAREAT